MADERPEIDLSTIDLTTEELLEQGRDRLEESRKALAALNEALESGPGVS